MYEIVKSEMFCGNQCDFYVCRPEKGRKEKICGMNTLFTKILSRFSSIRGTTMKR